MKKSPVLASSAFALLPLSGAWAAPRCAADDAPCRISMVLPVAHEMVSLADGTVLVAGGAWSGSTATPLPNDETLVAGGAADFEVAFSSAEIISGAGETTEPTSDMTVPRSGHTATLLPDGRVLIIGGFSGEAYLDSAELFDPASRSFTLINSKLSTPRANHTATRLNERYILIAGGEGGASLRSSPLDWVPLATAELFDMATMTFQPLAATMAEPRIYHQATVLDDTTVLLSGGIKGVADGNNSADLFVLDRQQFEPLQQMGHKRSLHTATRTAKGNVLLCGGISNDSSSGPRNWAPTPSAEVYEVSE